MNYIYSKLSLLLTPFKITSAFFIIIIMTVLQSPVKAQKAHTGIQAGLSFSDWIGDDAEKMANEFNTGFEGSGISNTNMDKKSRLGYSIGAFVNFRFTDIISLQPELLYTTEGTKFEGGGNYLGHNFTTEVTYKTNYLAIPLLLKITMPTKSFLPFFIIGPSFAFNLSSNVEVSADVEGQSASTEVSISDIKSPNYDLIFGVGFDTAMGIQFAVRYNMGLVSVIDSPDNIKIKNKVITIMAGMTF